MLSQCPNPAKVERDGQAFCGVHDPGGEPCGRWIYALVQGHDFPVMESAAILSKRAKTFKVKGSPATRYHNSVPVVGAVLNEVDAAAEYGQECHREVGKTFRAYRRAIKRRNLAMKINAYYEGRDSGKGDPLDWQTCDCMDVRNPDNTAPCPSCSDTGKVEP